MRRPGRGAAVLGLLMAGGVAGIALAQKPPALGAPDPGGKPPPAQAAPQAAPPAPPAIPRPAPQAGPTPGAADKFGQPVPPPAAAAPEADKFAAPAPGAPAAPSQQVAPAPRPAQPPAAAPPAQALQVTPASPEEPDTVRVLRGMLGADTRLGYAGVEVIDPARGAVRLREVALQRPDRSATIAELTLDGLREDGVTEALLRGVVLREAGAPAERVTVERVRLAGFRVTRPAAGQAFRPDMLSLDSLRIEGLAGEGATPVAIASLTVEDYARGRPGRLSLEGLEVRRPGEAPVDRVSLGRLAIRGVDMATLFAALVAREAPPRATGTASVEAEDLVLGQGDQRVGAVAAMTLSGESPPEGSAGVETGRFALRGISVQPFPGLQEWMQRFGYRELVADLTADVRIDRAAQRVEIAALSLAARDIAALGFSLTLEGLAPGETDPEALQRARLAAMRLRYVDQSLYQRFVRMQAQQTRRTEQQVREDFAGQARALFERPPGAPAPRGGAPGGKGGGGASAGAATVEIGNAIQRFLLGQAREIEIVAAPARPVPFTDLQAVAPGGPDALQQALGLRVVTR